jgi:antitoxin (DNA-binding transcriptional repressor) of toxin-antitoxin stability system
MFMLPRRISRALWNQAAAGEEIIIAKAGKPVAKLVPHTSRPDRPKRRLGALAGVAVVPPDLDVEPGTTKFIGAQ